MMTFGNYVRPFSVGPNITYCVFMIPEITGPQLLITIIDARSIANAYYYGVTHAWSGLLRMRWSTSRALERY